MKVVCLLLLGLTAVSAVSTCNKVVCSAPTTGNCASWASNEWKIEPCGSGKICDMTSTNLMNTSPTTKEYKCVDYTEPTPSGDTPTVTKQLTGTICTEDGGCWSGSCKENHCTGLAADGDCVTYNVASATGATDADKAKVCGANMYCKDDKCKAGPAKTETCLGITTDIRTQCAYPNICLANTCTEPGTVDNDAACTVSNLCKTGSYCNVDKCATMDVVYKSGGFGYPCTADAGCDPASCDGGCAAINKLGSAKCGKANADYTSKGYTDAARTDYLAAKNYCPLGAGTCTSGTSSMTIPDVETGECYGQFRMKNGVYLKLPTSSVNIAASLVAFLAYFLF